MKPLETNNLLLHAVAESDAEDAFAVLGDERVTRYMSMMPFPDAEFVRGCISRWKTKEGTPGWYVYGIYEKMTGRLVGIINTCGLHHGNPAIGYCLMPDAWGKGYMTEALQAFCRLLFADGYTCLVAQAAAENEASNRVLQKAGFGFIGSREEPLCDEKPEPVLTNEYRLLAESPARQAIRRAEDELQALMSVEEPFSLHLTRCRDDALPDMWDLNQFVYTEAPTEEEVEQAIAYQKKRQDRFVHLEGRKSLPAGLRKAFGLEESCTLTMVLTEGRCCHWTRNGAVTFRDLHHDPQIGEELLQLERRMYGTQYGEDFTERKMHHWLQTAARSKALNFYGAYLEGKLAGSVYTFRSGDYLLLDGLMVDEWARRQYVATSLLAAAIEGEGGLPVLHADADDTPKEMYVKLGFRLADYSYDSYGNW